MAHSDRLTYDRNGLAGADLVNAGMEEVLAERHANANKSHHGAGTIHSAVSNLPVSKWCEYCSFFASRVCYVIGESKRKRRRRTARRSFDDNHFAIHS